MCHSPSLQTLRRTTEIAVDAIIASVAGDHNAAATAARRIPPDDFDLLIETLLALTVKALGYGPGTHPSTASTTALTAWQVRAGTWTSIPIEGIPQPVRAYARALAAGLAHEIPNLHALIHSATRTGTPAERLELLRYCVVNAGTAFSRTSKDDG